MKSPSEFILLAESKRGVAGRIPYSMVTRDGSGMGKFFPAHDRKSVTTVFADGHAENLSLDDVRVIFHPNTVFAISANDTW